jgi:hypothetical protein
MSTRYERHELPLLARGLAGYAPAPDAVAAEVDYRGDGTADVTEHHEPPRTGRIGPRPVRRGPYPIRREMPRPGGGRGAGDVA